MTRTGQLAGEADRASCNDFGGDGPVSGDLRSGYGVGAESARDLAGAPAIAHSSGSRSRADALFDRDEVQGVLHGAFYSAGRPERALAGKERPDHYKVICISMYMDALAELDRMVTELKRRGFTKANRSALIRHALSMVDLDKVPRGL